MKTLQTFLKESRSSKKCKCGKSCKCKIEKAVTKGSGSYEHGKLFKTNESNNEKKELLSDLEMSYRNLYKHAPTSKDRKEWSKLSVAQLDDKVQLFKDIKKESVDDLDEQAISYMTTIDQIAKISKTDRSIVVNFALINRLSLKKVLASISHHGFTASNLIQAIKGKPNNEYIKKLQTL